MKKFETIAATTAPNGASVTLHRRGSDLFIHLDGEELMSTRSSESESALASLALHGLQGGERPQVLIGGLGLGFTLRSALTILPPAAVVTVAELLPAVVEWNRTYVDASRAALDDPRVRIVTRDVMAVMADGCGSRFQAILLDVDDGPSAVCFESNLGLYDREGLAQLKGCLAPGGVLAVWSAQTDPMFARRMRKSGFRVRVQSVRSHRQRGPRYTVFLGQKESPQARGRRSQIRRGGGN
jgi:spermidine synthase